MGGGTEAGSDPDIGAIVSVREETFKAESETADLWQPKWNKNQTVLAAAIHTPDRDAGPLEGWELEFRDCGAIPGQGLLLTAETDQGDVREETVVRNAHGGKPGSHGSKAILLSRIAGGAISITSLSLHRQHRQLNNRGWPIKRLMQRRTLPRCSFK